jgi:ATP-dependent RNA helicase DDX1
MFRRISSADASHVGGGAAAGPAPGSCSAPLAVIIEPARDLAEQTASCLKDYCRFLPSIKVDCFIGSSDSRRGREQVDCHIAGSSVWLGRCSFSLSAAVATPGRLLDLVQSHVLSLSKVTGAQFCRLPRRLLPHAPDCRCDFLFLMKQTVCLKLEICRV